MSPLWSGVYETIGNGNLGILPTSPVGTILAVGPCSKGKVKKIYMFSKADMRAVREELGYGDLPERLLDFLSTCGQKAKAIVVPAQIDTTGEMGDGFVLLPDPVIGDVIPGDSRAILKTEGIPSGEYKIVIQMGGSDATNHQDNTHFHNQVTNHNGVDFDTPIPEIVAEHGQIGELLRIGNEEFDSGVSIYWYDPQPNPAVDPFVDGSTFTFYTYQIGKVDVDRGPAGDPVGTYQLLIEFVKTGGFGKALFHYSIDNGETWSNLYTPVDGEDIDLTPTGMKISWEQVEFADAHVNYQFLAGTKIYGFCYGPKSSSVSLTEAMDEAVKAKLPFELVCAFTPTDRVAWTALASWSERLFNVHNSVRVLTEAFLPTVHNHRDPEEMQEYLIRLMTAMQGEEGTSAFASDRVAVCVGTARIVDTYGRVMVRGLSGLVAGLVAASPVYRSLGNTRYCRLTPIVQLANIILDYQTGAPAKGLDEAQFMTLDEARYIVPRQYVGLAGFYVNNGNMAASAISDFQSIETCRVMDNVIRNVRNTALRFVHSEVKVANGVADPTSLKALQGACQNTLNALRDTFSSARIEIPEDQDILATQTIYATISVVPFGYMKVINLGFNLAKL